MPRAFRGIAGFSGGNARAWVLTITRHAAFTWLSKYRSAALVIVEDLEEVERKEFRQGTAMAENENPEAALIAKADAQKLQAAIAQLPVPFREALVLRDVQGLDYREIAQVTNVPIGTVMSRLARARQRLMGHLRKRRAAVMTAASENNPKLLVHAYVDGELDPVHALELERHLAADPALAAERERIETLRRAIRERLPPVPVPLGLARRVENAIASTAREPSFFVRAFSRGTSMQGAGFGGPSWRALAASVMLALFVGSGSTWFAVRQTLNPRQETADMVVASHIRALMAPQPADVPSSDQHTVKPWFNGRVSEAPRVVDLGNEGFPLIGGRVDVIGRVPVATLVYRRRQHLISLFALPTEKAVPVSAPAAVAGYNILTWKQNGTVYWAVSDVAAPDLDAFAKAFREAGV